MRAARGRRRGSRGRSCGRGWRRTRCRGTAGRVSTYHRHEQGRAGQGRAAHRVAVCVPAGDGEGLVEQAVAYFAADMCPQAVHVGLQRGELPGSVGIGGCGGREGRRCSRGRGCYGSCCGRRCCRRRGRRAGARGCRGRGRRGRGAGEVHGGALEGEGEEGHRHREAKTARGGGRGKRRSGGD